jgi:hypothetical protein
MEREFQKNPSTQRPSTDTPEYARSFFPPAFGPKAETSLPPPPPIAEKVAPTVAPDAKKEDPASLQRLDEILNYYDVPEEEVIALCSKLTAAEKQTVLSTPSYRSRMAASLGFDEMKQAVNNLGAPLATKLDWMEASSYFVSAIAYSEIKDLVTSATQAERDALKTERWKDFFVTVCNDATMIEALKDLKFDPINAQLWLDAEGVPATAWKPVADANTSFGNLDEATQKKYRTDKDLVEKQYKALTAPAFAAFACNIMLWVPAECTDRAAAQAAASEIMKVQLGNKDVAKAAIFAGVNTVVVPRSKLLTEVSKFSHLAGKKTFDGRNWETTRGVLSGLNVAMAEENLLGGACTAVFGGKTVSGTYAEGYSTSSHEFAHGLHVNAMDAADKKTITDAFNARKILAKKAPKDANQWVDGREGCYASSNDKEFFAQLSNAYLGTNAGKDTTTGDPRHNSKEWVKTHEPKVYAILEKMYGTGSISKANPKPATK